MENLPEFAKCIKLPAASTIMMQNCIPYMCTWVMYCAAPQKKQSQHDTLVTLFQEADKKD